MRIQNTERQMTHIFILNSLLLRKNEMMMISKRCKKTNEPSQQILPTMQIIAQGILEYDIHICIVNNMHTYTSEMFLLLSYKKMK